MKNIIIFGGSFNPPTRAHEAIIRECLAQPLFDEVWVMPSGSRADKTIPTSDQDRLQMLQLLRHDSFADDPRMVVSDFELQLPRPTATRHTVRALTAAYPDVEFWFAFGDDSLRTMPTWPGAEEFMQNMRMIIFSADPDLPAPSDKRRFVPLPAEMRLVSSTAVRAAATNGGDVDLWVSPAIADYVARRGLYS